MEIRRLVVSRDVVYSEAGKKGARPITRAIGIAVIANPFAGQRSQFAKFTASHPPMEDRIARLRSGEWQN